MTTLTPSRLLVRSTTGPAADGRMVNVTPESAGWRHVGFEVYRLRAGQRLLGMEPPLSVGAEGPLDRGDAVVEREQRGNVGTGEQQSHADQ